MRKHLILRDARTGDINTVVRLLQDAYREHRVRFPAPVWESYRQELAAVGGRQAVSELVVALRAEEVVGTVTFYPEAHLDGHAWPPGVASLRLLAVHPSARRTGVGHALVDACVARARRTGASHLGLHTAPFMDAANRLYRERGFVRAPALDFDADVHYGGVPPASSTGRLAGEAYLLRVGPCAEEGTV